MWLAGDDQVNEEPQRFATLDFYGFAAVLDTRGTKKVNLQGRHLLFYSKMDKNRLNLSKICFWDANWDVRVTPDFYTAVNS